MIVLAIDVGLRATGYVVCELEREVKFHKEGQVITKGKNLPLRLYTIQQEIEKVICNYSPKVMVLEKLYSHYRHPTTVKTLSEVKGCLLVLCARYNLEYYEFLPTKARKALLGRGSVDSQRVKKVAESILGRQLLSLHTADAFSLVIAYFHYLGKGIVFGGDRKARNYDWTSSRNIA